LIIGVPKEIKSNEYRVAIMAAGVRAMVENGHKVIIQKSAGEGSGVSDAEYISAGAQVKANAEEIFKEADMIIKVKEPLVQEYDLFREGQLLFTYLHLAPASDLTKALLERKIVGVAYETIQLENGSLPLLTPMSEVAGKLSIQIGAHWLQKENGGRGILLGGVPGTSPANVVIIGGGVVGSNAAKIALGMGANVTVLDINLDRLRYLTDMMQGRITLLVSNNDNLEKIIYEADLVIGSLLIPGAKAKKVVTRNMITRMRKGSVIVDVAIDQGGCIEGSIPTTHANPVIMIDGVILYCVANLPGCVPITSSIALTNATLPYVLQLANLGYKEAFNRNISLRKGLNLYKGKLTNKQVAEDTGIIYTPYENLSCF
jgi:alanine dehydrogenase